MRTLLYQVFGLLLFLPAAQAQDSLREPWHFLAPADTFNRQRFWILAGSGAAAYTAASVGLYSIWYKDYPLGKFQIFDDFGEWEHVDKAGHLFTAYFQSHLAYHGARWTGIKHRPAAWIGAGVSTLLQSTIEVMDGFSTNWGFSIPDATFNTLGTGIFLAQALTWGDQRLLIKVSNTRPNYPNTPITGRPSGLLTHRQIAHALYGENYAEAFVKDYNGMTVWASLNPSSFFPRVERTWFPRWLNVSFGYGAQNVYGAYGNAYTDPQGNVFPLANFPRYQQYYLSLDIDPTRIRTRSRLLKTLFLGLSWIKIPAPTMEWNTLGQRKWHWIYW